MHHMQQQVIQENTFVFDRHPSNLSDSIIQPDVLVVMLASFHADSTTVTKLLHELYLSLNPIKNIYILNCAQYLTLSKQWTYSTGRGSVYEQKVYSRRNGFFWGGFYF